MHFPQPPGPRNLRCPTPLSETVYGGRHRGGASDAIQGAPLSSIVYAHLDVDLPQGVFESEELANVYVNTARILALGEDPETACSEGVPELIEAAFRDDYETVFSDLADAAQIEIETSEGPIAGLVARVSDIASESEEALSDAVFGMLNDIADRCSEILSDRYGVESGSIEDVVIEAMLAPVGPKRSLTRMYLARMVVWFVVCIAIEGSYSSEAHEAHDVNESGSDLEGEDYDAQQAISGGGSRAQSKFTAPMAMTALAAGLTLASSLRF